MIRRLSSEKNQADLKKFNQIEKNFILKVPLLITKKNKMAYILKKNIIKEVNKMLHCGHLKYNTSTCSPISLLNPNTVTGFRVLRNLSLDGLHFHFFLFY